MQIPHSLYHRTTSQLHGPAVSSQYLFLLPVCFRADILQFSCSVIPGRTVIMADNVAQNLEKMKLEDKKDVRHLKFYSYDLVMKWK